MGLTYFKRFRMEIDVTGPLPKPQVPAGYELRPWDAALLAAHSDAKFRSFRDELDANVFPCLGDAAGCYRLMTEISQKQGFLPEATWLAVAKATDGEPEEYCGTVQGIRERLGTGAIQNLGITPEHRDQGLGSCLLLTALYGFRRAGLTFVQLEVTAENVGAIRLYRRIGFSVVKTVFKVAEVAYS
jgi:ribosomal protein S18 acetylase RimI-like enzyme